MLRVKVEELRCDRRATISSLNLDHVFDISTVKIQIELVHFQPERVHLFIPSEVQ